MPAEPKRVPFDPHNVNVSSNLDSGSIQMRLMIPCEDGAMADVVFQVDAPLRTEAEDGSKKYSLKVTSREQVTNPDRVHPGIGMRRRSDGLYWEIPPNFPEAVVGLLEHEGKVKEFLMPRFKAGQTFVDVGANVGGYSLRAAAFDMKVYAFEPNPDNLTLLRRNIEINKLPVEVLPYALGSKAAKARLAPNGGVSRIVEKEGVEVDMRTLDSFDLPAADLLKIDVEGFELEVIRGAEKTLEKYHPVMMVEMHYWAGAENEAELFETLKGLGYKLEYIDRYGKGMHLSAFPEKMDGKS